MDDLVSKLQEILGSEEGMQKLKNVADMLGVGNATTEKNAQESKDGNGQANQFDLSALTGLLAPQSSSGSPNSNDGSSPFDLGGIDIQTILKLQQVMSAFHNEDDNTRFLQALRPLMREDRRHKVDEVLKMMKLFSLIPLLKESGILDNLFQ